MQITSLSSGLATLLSPMPREASNVPATAPGQSQWAAPSRGGVTAMPPKDTSETFSAEIMRRLESARPASGAGTALASGAAGNLQAALADTIEDIREQHGDAAATAVMGIILKGVGDGAGGEDALGNALVSSLKFIDRNFGIAAGDAAMARYNGALNSAVNEYFQNGRDEMFYASDGSGGTTEKIKGILGTALSRVAERFGKDAAATVADILTSTLEQAGLTRKGLGQAVAAADDYLLERHGTADFLGSLAGTEAVAAPDKGSVLDLAV